MAFYNGKFQIHDSTNRELKMIKNLHIHGTDFFPHYFLT